MKPAQALSTHVALLRGINVGGKNMLPMKDLVEMFTEAGCTGVRTYIQSGNVVFDALPALVQTIPAHITNRIEELFGLRIPVILRTASEMATASRNNPFMKTGVDEKLLYVFFLAHLPAPENVLKLDPGRSVPDSFSVHNREIYLHLPNGAGRTKLTNAWFDTKLATTSTARNWRTVLTLTQMILERGTRRGTQP